MNKKIYAIILVILVVGLLMTACERSASVSPVTTPTTSGEIPFPVASQSQIMKDILAATQTAAVMQGTLTTGALPGLATSTPAFTYITATPAAKDLDTSTATPASTTSSVTTATEISATSISATATPTLMTYTYPTATPGKPTQYIIQPGEYPYCIARRFDVDPAELLQINGLNNNSMVSPGTFLNIPQDGSFPYTRALKAHPAVYTANYGDTVNSIACWFGDVDPNTILAANGLSAGTVLSQGQVLQIP